MDVEIVKVPPFSVIGKLGQGPTNSGPQWIKPLWDEANGNFKDIRGLVRYDEEGRPVGIWGIMSDVAEQFERWGRGQGKYLAGCEVNDDAIPPSGWTLWKVPSQTYVVASCTSDNYGETFTYILNGYLPENGYELIGAVHENFSQDAEEGAIRLYFPIMRD